ncbi:uncharacterized protein LOC127379201 isoform X2 [Dicentrarchus labrax]|uniref:Type I cytokine receptor cytokine-binding domain-containing protein n=2 Tax=Dicentrarchus labrax TaxID=13489 RepID=A0A8P4GHK1_DICLA|nr:uncharacterized protein LOC127379201 isoform X2 [Dicentrarchus labrax]
MDGGDLFLTVKTVCNKNESEPFDINITYPELVRDLQCYIYSSTQSYCSWIPVSHASNLTFFYFLTEENFTGKAYSDLNHTTILYLECSSYTPSNGVRTGCDLQSNVNQGIHIVFNATVDNKPARNTFQIKASKVNLPAPDWGLIYYGNKLSINWSTPDIFHPSDWKILLNVTKCNKEVLKPFSGVNSYELDIDPSCRYCISLKAQMFYERGETPWTNRTCFGRDKAPEALYAVLIIPLLLSGLAALMLVCCMKNKNNIFPKVPEPRDLLSDISDNNNKSTVCNLYIPAEEEHSCKITLVLDPEINKP